MTSRERELNSLQYREPHPVQQVCELPPEAVEGNLFISAYPPFSSWKPQHVSDVERYLQTAPVAAAQVELGIYIHVPFCLERCQFCYYRSYADQSQETVDQYVDAVGIFRAGIDRTGGRGRQRGDAGLRPAVLG